MKTFALPLAAALFATTAAFAAGQAAKPADQAEAPVKVDTATFVKVASGANEFELQSSKMAEEKASAADVKELAATIIKDHTRAGENLKAALQKSGKPLPAEPAMLAPKQAAMLKLLEQASGPAFDALYIEQQAGAHMEAVTLFRNFAKTGDDKNVVAFAKETLPNFEMHTTHVMEVVQAH